MSEATGTVRLGKRTAEVKWALVGLLVPRALLSR